MTITTLQAKTTQTGAFLGTGVDVSAITGDWTVVVEVQKMSAVTGVPQLRIGFQDTVDSFTTVVAGPTVALQGALGSAASAANPRRFTFKKYDFPDLRLGTASAKVRVAVLALTAVGGATPSCDYQAWIES